MTATPPVNRFYAEPVETDWDELIAAWQAEQLQVAS